MPMCGGQSDRFLTAIEYISVPTELHSLLVGGIDYSQDTFAMCGRLIMACNVTKGSSHDEDKSVTGLQREVDGEGWRNMASWLSI